MLRRNLFVCAAILTLLVGCNGSESGTRQTVNRPAIPSIATHPVFHTAITGQSGVRPAIQVDIKDESEDVFFTAELYLSVQSSRFPNDTRILLPLNVGDFAGCRTRFVQLPFEVEQGDTLLFNLLDNDELSYEQEQLILRGCRAAGYCILYAGNIYCPEAAAVVSPIVPVAADILGTAIVQDIAVHQFENFGTAEFIAPAQLPNDPHQANELSIRNESNYVPAVLKLFGPPEPMAFSYGAAT